MAWYRIKLRQGPRFATVKRPNPLCPLPRTLRLPRKSPHEVREQPWLGNYLNPVEFMAIAYIRGLFCPFPRNPAPRVRLRARAAGQPWLGNN